MINLNLKDCLWFVYENSAKIFFDLYQLLTLRKRMHTIAHIQTYVQVLIDWLVLKHC